MNKELTALEKQAKQNAKEQTRVDQLKESIVAKERQRNDLNSTKPLDDLNQQETDLK